jgi:hypothetical protein
LRQALKQQQSALRVLEFQWWCPALLQKQLLLVPGCELVPVPVPLLLLLQALLLQLLLLLQVWV